MPYQLTCHNHLGYIHLEYHGRVDLEERLAAREAVFGLCRQHGLTRSLVDLSQSDIRLSEKDALTFATSFSKAGLPPRYRLACVVRGGGGNEKLIEVIIAQGGVDVKYFYSTEEALYWLMAV